MMMFCVFLLCKYVLLVSSLKRTGVPNTVFELYTPHDYMHEQSAGNTSTSFSTKIGTKDYEFKKVDSVANLRRALTNHQLVQGTRYNVTLAEVSNISLLQKKSKKQQSVSALKVTSIALMNTSSRVSSPIAGRQYLMDSSKCNGTPVLEQPSTIFLTVGIGVQYTDCTWDVLAPAGHFIVIPVNRSALLCNNGVVTVYDSMAVYNTLGIDTVPCVTLLCQRDAPPVLYSSSNELTIYFFFRILYTIGSARLRFSFIGERPERKKLSVEFVSSHSGFIASPAYHSSSKNAFPLCCVDAYTLHVPPHHVVLISFSDFQLSKSGCRVNTFLNVFRFSKENGTVQLVRKECSKQAISVGGLPPTALYNTSLLFQFVSDKGQADNLPGFKLLFSFHNKSSIPEQQPDGLFNCSSVNYHAFRHHLDCNFAVECIAGEDEVNCPDFAAECNGSVKFGNKCYHYFIWQANRSLSWYDAEKFCQQQGRQLVMFKTKTDWYNIQKILLKRKSVRDIFVGLQTASFTTPVYYRYALQWSDSTINYSRLPTTIPADIIKSRLCYVLISGYFYLTDENCERNLQKDVICENTLPANVQNGISFSPHTGQWPQSAKALLRMVSCHNGHVTHYFLSCHSDNCSSSQRQLDCASNIKKFGIFLCANGQGIPFTLVCDFYDDCSDRSDESFCKHTKCETDCSVHRQCSAENICGNGQCVSIDSWCDGRQDCRDGSDEMCEIPGHEQTNVTDATSHTVISFDGYGDFTSVPITSSTGCPETHFQCPDSFCLPVYLRCNQIYDCPDWEDETDCHTATCPGFYRCRNSSVCLHADHVCDGVFQCPRQDDELLCGLTCPEGCQCQGLSFVCATPFPVASHHQVRYVDASGSGMTPDDFQYNHYLIYLRLSRCRLNTAGNLSLDNLQLFDLRGNSISSFATDVALKFENLQHLILSNNPLVTLSPCCETPQFHKSLSVIDLSHTLVTEFPEGICRAFVNLRVLNVSFSQLMMLPDGCFRRNTNLEVLDIRDVELKIFSGKIFHGLRKLKAVFSSNYRLCCQSVLPFNFDHGNCFAPRDEISSCEDLLRSDMYRLFLWLFASLSTAGNAGSLLFRMVQTTPSNAGHNVFVTSLSASDLLMGSYLTVIGVADHTYRGRYLWHDLAWKMSVMCKVAGFIAFLSNEVSAFIVFLITLDRFVALHFPFSIIRFKRRSALAACATVWMVGISLAAVPLLPGMSDWDYYSQTSICIPLPVTRSYSKGRAYSFGVMIILNLVLFLLIAGGQAFVYWSVRVNSLQDRASSKKLQDATIARRLITVALSDFLCWFPIGVLGILASLRIPIPGEVNVSLVIFVLPVNSALNPFLYTFNVIMEKRKKVKRMKRMRKLEEEFIKRLHSSLPDAENNLAT